MTQPIEIHTLAGAYALDALTEFERASFSRHIGDCEACATEVAELRETAARLSVMAWATPPPSLKTNVLAEISRTRQVGPQTTERERRPANDVRRWRRLTLVAAAAAVVGLAGAGVTVIMAEQRADEYAAAEQRRAQIDSVLTAPDSTVRTQDIPGGGRVTMVVSPARNQGVVVMSDLPAPPTDKVYQLWVIRSDTEIDAGPVMEPGQVGGTALVSNVVGAARLGVTREPVGGSTEPNLQELVTTVNL